VRGLAWTLAAALLIHLGLIVVENVLARGGTRHRELATRAIRRGAFARLFWGAAVAPAAAAMVATAVSTNMPPVLGITAVAALASSFVWEYIWVEAGQSVPLS
jgi:hypothetical protein